jgi:hypothetical protein
MSLQLSVAKNLQSSGVHPAVDRTGDIGKPFLTAGLDRSSRTLFLERHSVPAVTALKCRTGLMGYGLDYSPDSSHDVSDFMNDCPRTSETPGGLRLQVEDSDTDISVSPDDPEVVAAAAYLNRAKAARLGVSKGSFRQLVNHDMHDSSSDDEEEERVVNPPPDEGWLTQVGVCETLYLASGNSQPLLLAMAQGMICRPGDPYSGVYVFDIETDDLLKAFPQAQKKLYYPIVNHLCWDTQYPIGFPLRFSVRIRPL